MRVNMWSVEASSGCDKPPGMTTGGIPESPAGTVRTGAAVIWFSQHYWILKTQYLVYSVLLLSAKDQPAIYTSEVAIDLR